MEISDAVTNEVLKAHYCLENVDRVAGDPETTAFKRRARLQQALWRESQGLPIGTQPMRPQAASQSRLLGSRIPVDVARATGANFLSDAAFKAVQHRLANPQPRETLDSDRLYCDLLSSMPMCFNLFAELQADLRLADRAVHTWWPDVPGTVVDVLFEWSPGRQILGEYLENRSAFDVAFILDLGDGKQGVLGVETKYHEHCAKCDTPSAQRLERYSEVTQSSGLMMADAMPAVIGTELQQIWLDHLLAASMPLHKSGRWGWAGFALVHPSRSASYARAVQRYRSYLVAPGAVHVSTIEDLLAADVLPVSTSATFRARYLW